MGKRPMKNPSTGSFAAGKNNTLRGLRVNVRHRRAEFMRKKFDPTTEHTEETERDLLLARRRGQSSERVTLTPIAMEQIKVTALLAQSNIKVKKKKEDQTPFSPTNSDLLGARYRVMGTKKQSGSRPTLASKIAEGRFPHLLDQLGENAVVTSIEMQVGNDWVVMTHPDYLKATREHFVISA